MEFKVERNYLFIFYHWLNNFDLDKIKYQAKKKISFFSSTNGKLYITHNPFEFIKVGIKDELFVKKNNSISSEKLNYNLYFSYKNDYKSGIDSTIYLFEFENEEVEYIIPSISYEYFRKDLEKILCKVNRMYSKKLEINKEFSSINFYTILFLDSNKSLNEFNDISELVISFRDFIDRHYYLNPFLFFNVVIDSDYILSNRMKNAIIYGIDKFYPSEKKDRVLLPFGLFSFIDFLSLMNLLKRFNYEIINSDIFKLTISKYVSGAINHKNISVFFKDNYLKKDKLKSSSSRVLFLYKADRLMNDFSKTTDYEILSNMKISHSLIKVNNEAAAFPFKKALFDSYIKLTNELKDNATLLKTKEIILNDFFRDLSTITTNELNLVLQRRMKSLTVLAIGVTLIGVLLSFKTEILNLFK